MATLTREEYVTLMNIATVSKDLLEELTEFEIKVVRELQPRFREFGWKFAVKGRQWDLYREISEKITRLRSIPK